LIKWPKATKDAQRTGAVPRRSDYADELNLTIRSRMTTIIGISGSLRHGSFNSALLRAAVELMPPGRKMFCRDFAEIHIESYVA